MSKKKKVIKTVEKKEVKVQEIKRVEKKEFPISFAEFSENLDNYKSRSLKIYANVSNVLEEKPRSQWEFLLAQLEYKPIV